MTATTPRPLIVTESLLVRAPTAAGMLGISVRALRRLDSAGAIPQAIKLGGMKSKLWRVRSLAEWCDDGCPSRDAINSKCRTAAPAGKLKPMATNEEQTDGSRQL